MKVLIRKLLYRLFHSHVKLNAYNEPTEIGYTHSVTLFGHCLGFIEYQTNSDSSPNLFFAW